jgi:hypothetical protein
VEQGNSRADQRCLHTLEAALESTLTGYTFHTSYRDNPVTISRGKVNYALLPVWLLNVKWNDGNYLFAINGQTGKVCGRLPASKGKAWAYFAKLAVPLSIAAAVLAQKLGEHAQLTTPVAYVPGFTEPFFQKALGLMLPALGIEGVKPGNYGRNIDGVLTGLGIGYAGILAAVKDAAGFNVVHITPFLKAVAFKCIIIKKFNSMEANQ